MVKNLFIACFRLEFLTGEGSQLTFLVIVLAAEINTSANKIWSHCSPTPVAALHSYQAQVTNVFRQKFGEPFDFFLRNYQLYQFRKS